MLTWIDLVLLLWQGQVYFLMLYRRKYYIKRFLGSWCTTWYAVNKMSTRGQGHSLTLERSHLYSTISDTFFYKTNRQMRTNFHMGLQRSEKVCQSCLVKFCSMPRKKRLPWIWYIIGSTLLLIIFFKRWPWSTLDLFKARSKSASLSFHLYIVN